MGVQSMKKTNTRWKVGYNWAHDQIRDGVEFLVTEDNGSVITGVMEDWHYTGTTAELIAKDAAGNEIEGFLEWAGEGRRLGDPAGAGFYIFKIDFKPDRSMFFGVLTRIDNGKIHWSGPIWGERTA